MSVKNRMKGNRISDSTTVDHSAINLRRSTYFSKCLALCHKNVNGWRDIEVGQKRWMDCVRNNMKDRQSVIA